MAGKDAIREHMEVIGADGVHVGTVDHVEGDRIKLTKADSGQGSHEGHHHYISLGLVADVEGDKVRLSANADVAVTFEEEESSSVLSTALSAPPPLAFGCAPVLMRAEGGMTMGRSVLACAAALAALSPLGAAAAAPAHRLAHARGVEDPRAFVAQRFAGYRSSSEHVPPDPVWAYSPRLTALFAVYKLGSARITTRSARSTSTGGSTRRIGSCRSVSVTAADTGPNARTVTARWHNSDTRRFEPLPVRPHRRPLVSRRRRPRQRPRRRRLDPVGAAPRIRRHDGIPSLKGRVREALLAPPLQGRGWGGGCLSAAGPDTRPTWS